jgi:hypothetical protein
MGVGGRVGKAPVVLPANARHAMVLSCYAASYWRLSGKVDGDVGCLLIGIQKAAGCCNCKPNNEHQTSLELPIVGPRGTGDWRLGVEPLPQCGTRWQDPGLTSPDLTRLARDTKTLLKSTPHLQGLRISQAVELSNNSLLTPPIFALGRTWVHNDVISSPASISLPTPLEVPFRQHCSLQIALARRQHACQSAPPYQLSISL